MHSTKEPPHPYHLESSRPLYLQKPSVETQEWETGVRYLPPLFFLSKCWSISSQCTKREHVSSKHTSKSWNSLPQGAVKTKNINGLRKIYVTPHTLCPRLPIHATIWRQLSAPADCWRTGHAPLLAYQVSILPSHTQTLDFRSNQLCSLKCSRGNIYANIWGIGCILKTYALTKMLEETL